MILQFPVNYISVTTEYSSSHMAIDLGWFRNKPKTKEQDIVAVADGVVFAKRLLKDGGYTIYTRHEGKNHTYYGGYMHMREHSHLNVGDKVKAGQKIGVMGDTGESYGNHVHFILWRAPKGYELSTYNRSYRVNPLDYLKRMPHQEDLRNRFPVYKGKEKPVEVTGDKVTVKKSAKKFTTGESMANWVKGSTFDVLQKGKGKTLISRKGTAIGWVSDSDLEGSSKPSNRVKVKKSATHFATGEKMDSWVKGSTFDVKERGKGRTLIANKGSIIGWVKDSDLEGSSSTPKPQPKPKPQPATKVGKYANFKGKVRLFIKSRGDECYPVKNGKAKKNVHTSVRATSAKIIKEDNGRVLVSVPRFSPQRVWIANSESTVTDKPLYKA